MSDPYVTVTFETTRTSAHALLASLRTAKQDYSPLGIGHSALIKALVHSLIRFEGSEEETSSK